MKLKKQNLKKMIVFLVAIFITIVVAGVTFCTKYIDHKLRQSNMNSAVDIALIVSNNFHISDAEVAYMKSLTFNEMEVDDINMRLMNIGNDVKLNAKVSNVYILAPLAQQEIKYHVDENISEFFGFEVGTPLDGIWLLNGKMDENGHFLKAEREDVYRYTHLTDEERQAMKEQKAFGIFTSDAWGDFITGYAPVYTTEGNFVGILGIDMDPDKFHNDVHSMVMVLMEFLIFTSIALVGLFVFFYFKYTEVEKAKLYFDFYSRMSHDMRTPMNGIMGMVKLAESEDDLTELHGYFDKIGESSEYLLHLINDTLDVSRISSGKMSLHMERVRCGYMIHNIIDMVEESAEQHELLFEKENRDIHGDELVLMDPVRFKQIFVNLLTNAIKYTSPGGKISFITECVEKTEEHMKCRFIVGDTGVGMSEEYVNKSLYQPFSQEHNKLTDNYAGSGLGLSITKSLIELMGGTISVETNIGQGTVFTVELEFQRAYLDEEEQKRLSSNHKIHKERKLNGTKILLCEDHPLNAEIAVKLLEREGCVVTTAVNGQVGVDLFQQSEIGEYDIILMDIRMPVMDGLKATKVIRGMDRADAKTVPIIAMTANAYAEDIENSREAGMNAHLSKPIQIESLYDTIESMTHKNVK